MQVGQTAVRTEKVDQHIGQRNGAFTLRGFGRVILPRLFGGEVVGSADVYNLAVPVEITPLQGQHFTTAEAQIVQQGDHQPIGGGLGNSQELFGQIVPDGLLLRLLLCGGPQEGRSKIVGQHPLGHGVLHGMDENGAYQTDGGFIHACAGIQTGLQIGPANSPKELHFREKGHDMHVDGVLIIAQRGGGFDARPLDDVEPFQNQLLKGDASRVNAVDELFADPPGVFFQLPAGGPAGIFDAHAGNGDLLTVAAVFLFGHGCLLEVNSMIQKRAVYAALNSCFPSRQAH